MLESLFLVLPLLQALYCKMYAFTSALSLSRFKYRRSVPYLVLWARSDPDGRAVRVLEYSRGLYLLSSPGQNLKSESETQSF